MPLSTRRSYRLSSAAALSIVLIASLKVSIRDPSRFLDFRHYVTSPTTPPDVADDPADAASGKAVGRPWFVLIDPPIMTSVNGVGKARYVEVTVAFRTAGKRDADLVRSHVPRLRSIVMNVLQDYSYEVLMRNSGREAARSESLRAVRRALADQSVAAVITDVLFTTFAGQ